GNSQSMHQPPRGNGASSGGKSPIQSVLDTGWSARRLTRTTAAGTGEEIAARFIRSATFFYVLRSVTTRASGRTAKEPNGSQPPALCQRQTFAHTINRARLIEVARRTVMRAHLPKTPLKFEWML